MGMKKDLIDKTMIISFYSQIFYLWKIYVLFVSSVSARNTIVQVWHRTNFGNFWHAWIMQFLIPILSILLVTNFGNFGGNCLPIWTIKKLANFGNFQARIGTNFRT